MSKRWSVFLRGFPDDPQRGLIQIHALALMRVEPLLNIALGCFDRRQAGRKLYLAVLADTEQGMVTHDPRVGATK
jgi:hypothetical protein